jgi:hypothetical protein
MTTDYIQPRLNIPLIGWVKLNTIQRKEFEDGEEVKVRYSWVRGSCPFCRNYLFYPFTLLTATRVQKATCHR